MPFQDAFLCSPRNDQWLDSPPSRKAAGEAEASPEKHKNRHRQQHQHPKQDDDEDGDGGLLQRSRARREERAQLVKECEMMMSTTTKMMMKMNMNVNANTNTTATATTTDKPKKKVPSPWILSSPQPPTIISLSGGTTTSLRMKKLWDFNHNDDDDHDDAALQTRQLQQQQQRDDDDHPIDYRNSNFVTNNDFDLDGDVIFNNSSSNNNRINHDDDDDEDDDDDDDDDDDKTWSSSKIRRESRRSMLGVHSMRAKNEFTEVERYVAEMRRKRLTREEGRRHSHGHGKMSDGEREENEELVEKTEKKKEEEEVGEEEGKHDQVHARKIDSYIGINRCEDDDLEEYTAIRAAELQNSSPREARLQRIREWNKANSSNSNHQSVISSMSTTIRRTKSSNNASSSSSCANRTTHLHHGCSKHREAALTLSTNKINGRFLSENEEEEDDEGKGEETEGQTCLTDSELKRWWIEHKRFNHIHVNMPSFEELVGEPTINNYSERQSAEEFTRTTTTTAMRIEQLRCRRKGADDRQRTDSNSRGHPPHPEGSATTSKQQ